MCRCTRCRAVVCRQQQCRCCRATGDEECTASRCVVDRTAVTLPGLTTECVTLHSDGDECIRDERAL